MKYNFKELVDIGELQKLTDELFEASSIASFIIATNGEILTGSGWQRICTDFHRKNPRSAKDCNENDTKKREGLDKGEPFVMYKCPRGLVEGSSPVIIEGEHVATVFAGQVFLEPPDQSTKQYFKEQAKEFGFDEQEYMEAFREVPVFSEKKFRAVMAFLSRLAQVIAKKGLQQLREMETNAKLEASEEKYRILTEKMRDLVFVIELKNMKATYFNPSVTRMRGYTVEEAHAQPFQEMATPDSIEKVSLEIADALAMEAQEKYSVKERTVEIDLTCKDGSTVCAEVRCSFLRDEKGIPNAILGVSRDITERKLAENEIAKFKTISQKALHGNAIVDLQGNIIYINDYFAKAHGYKPEELLGQNLAFFHTEKQLEAVVEINSALKKDGSYSSTEVWHVHRNGTEFPMLMSGIVINDNNDTPQYLAATAIDITKLKKTEEKLQIAEETYRNIFLDSPVGLFRTDMNTGLIMDSNDAVARFIGFDNREQMLSEPFNIGERYVDPHEREKMISVLKKDGSFRDYEARFRKNDGTISIMKYSAKLRADKGWIEGVSEDITERRLAENEKSKLEGQFQQAQKMESVGRLAGGVAHDFNNLLTGICGNISLAQMDLSTNDPIYKMLGEINDATDRATDLTRQLLAFSRKQIIEPKVINLNDLIENIYKMLCRIIGEDVEIRTIPMKQLGQIKADPGQIEQIITNLAVNSRDAMPDGGKLTIETFNVNLDEEFCKEHANVEPGDYIMLAITDNGEGIDKDTKKNIFDPFFTTKAEGRGTGLGLATVYGIVKQHGGHVEVYSEIGVGTVFKIYFPEVQSRAEAITRTSLLSDLPRGTETVLVVEDESIVKNIAVKILSRLGYQVMSADNGPHALALANADDVPVDLLLTDIVMPNMNGRKLAEELHKQYPKMKVLFTSGYTEDVIVHHSVLEEGLNFIGKPYTPSTLGEKVRKVLDA